MKMGFIKNIKKYLPKEDKKLKAIKVKAKEHEQKEYYKAKEKYEMSEASKRAKARASKPSGGFGALLSGFAPGKTSKGGMGKSVDLNAALFGGGGVLGGGSKQKKFRTIGPRDLF